MSLFTKIFVLCIISGFFTTGLAWVLFWGLGILIPPWRKRTGDAPAASGEEEGK